LHLPFKARTCIRGIMNDALASPVPQMTPGGAPGEMVRTDLRHLR
jgi:hypothetical protein